MREEFVWAEKYRPKSVSECCLPSALKNQFQSYVDNKEIPNMMLCGGPGMGKTTVARAMLDEIGADYIVINGSLEGNIDTLRNEIKDFASSVSFTEGRKYVILDEADYLNPQSTQPALRGFIEEFSANCGFILTCNFKNKVIEPLHSRCPPIEFKFNKDDTIQVAGGILKRIFNILTKEGVSFDKAVVAEVVKKTMPDWRRAINQLQHYGNSGSIDTGILRDLNEENMNELIDIVKKKNWIEMRKWIGENESDFTTLSRKFYDQSYDIFKAHYIPELVILIAKYQYQAAFVADQEINTVAFFSEVMVNAEFK